MYLTEEEAKGKWCPQIRLTLDEKIGDVSINRLFDGSIPPNAYCIASECMMWRREQRKPDAPILKPGQNRGYCGLGGKP